MYYSLFFLFTLPPPTNMTQITPTTCIYLNGLILFPDKTLPLFAPATYLYIMSMGLLRAD